MTEPARRVAGARDGRGKPSFSAAFRWAWSSYRSHAPRILLLLLAWASVWVVVELLVFGSRSAPGRPVWLVLHLAYFWGTAYWEGAILRSTLDAIDGAPRSWHRVPRDHRLVLRFLVLKMLFLPATLGGAALLLVPGLYWAARLGPAFYCLVEEQGSLSAALGRGNEVGRGRRGRLMLIILGLILINALGAVLLGMGLVVTVPLSALMCAHVFRQIGVGSARP